MVKAPHRAAKADNVKANIAKANAGGNYMKRRISLSLLAAACASLPLALVAPGQAHAQSVMRPSSSIVLSIGRGQLVSVPGVMKDVFVANESVADVQIKSQRQLYIFGKTAGETTIYASNAAGQVVWSSNVRVGSNIESVDQMLNLAMPDAKITVTSVGTNTYLMTGTVASPEDAAEAQRLVQAFVGGGASGGAGASGGGAINVISRLKTATPLQVNLRVRFAEVSRTLVRQIGVNLSSIDSSSGFKFGIGQARAGYLPQFTPGGPLGVGLTTGPAGSSIVTTIANGTTIGMAGKFLGLDLASALDLGETIGLVTTLSEPNLTALSGETADFLAGGEYPIPISQGLGATSIEYKRYGVSLAYTPTVLANGRISIRVRPEVSELSSQGAVTLNGFQVPALTIRRAETTVELGSGQSFMIAGLMSNNAQNTIQKTPGAGDIPILGALFRSTSFKRGDTELVIVVTPYLVQPVDANDIKLPTDGYQSPHELQRLLGNMGSDGKSEVSRPMPSAAPPRVSGPQVGIDNSAAPGSGRAARTGAGNAHSSEANAPTPGFNLK
jgi:pilus assembly protein CpaC